MKFSVTVMQFLTIEADDEDAAYEEAHEIMYRQYRLLPDVIDVEPLEDEE